jgi:catechol 2,3-dioxygenase-like lactoylglutathione lyase family enzyme
MDIKAHQFVVKVSVSDMRASRAFYEDILGFHEEPAYTIDSGGNFGPESYMQLRSAAEKNIFSIGLYKDIDAPFTPLPQTGSVPSFLVGDLNGALAALKAAGVTIDNADAPVITNVSDEGYMDKFFFFRDPDNNSLVMRQNFGRQIPDEAA